MKENQKEKKNMKQIARTVVVERTLIE